MTIKPINATPEQWAKRMFKLLYDAAGVFGMGAFQMRESVTEEQVWENIVTRGDYPGHREPRTDRCHADYVFGRMMKFDAQISEDSVTFRDGPYRSDYQSWCRTYPTPESIIEAVDNSFKLREVFE